MHYLYIWPMLNVTYLLFIVVTIGVAVAVVAVVVLALGGIVATIYHCWHKLIDFLFCCL